MNSSIFFRTEAGNNYLYDTKLQQLLNVHPVIELIHNFGEKEDITGLVQSVREKFPELQVFDIHFYLKKYDFLKSQGFFEMLDFDQLLTFQISANQVLDQIKNLDAITFQVTGACNLNCRYCCYGEMYDNTHNITQPMDFDTVQSLFEYITPYWSLNPNPKKITIGFYGGEPLLNFSLIEKTVSYCRALESTDFEFNFSITTNALLLDRYADFLVENSFNILFSLDGNEKGNSLRVDKNNQPVFSRVFKSIKQFQAKYPDFFKEKVNFNAVLNSYSLAKEVNDFIINEFGIIPLLSRISEVGLNKEKVKEYRQIMQPYIETDELMALRKDKSSKIKELGGFFYYNLSNSFKHFSEIVHISKRDQKKIPTGTCLPFLKKMYITSDRRIFACERIGFDYVLGTIGEKVNIDFEEVARKYTTYFTEIGKQCVTCYFALICSDCIFQFPTENDMPKCPYIFGVDDYQKHLGRLTGLTETHPELFDKVNKFVLA